MTALFECPCGARERVAPQALARKLRCAGCARERRNAARRRRYASDPAATKARSAAWAREHREEVNARERDRYPDRAEVLRRSRQKLRAEVLNAYGAACACCGTTYEPHLTLDHVHEDGAARRGPGRNNSGEYRRAKREGYPDTFQVLCWNCNVTKRMRGRCACQEVTVLAACG